MNQKLFSTNRTDNWWIEPSLTAFGFLAFVVYTTWRAFSGEYFVEQNYFPESFANTPVFYTPQNEGREKFLKERLEKLWQDRYT